VNSYKFSNYTPHKGQWQLHNSTSREIVVVSAIRAGKSFGVMHDAIKSAWNNPTDFGTLICAPTYRLLSAVLEKPMISILSDLGLLKSNNFTDHEATLKNGKKIYFRSLEEPDNALRGLNIWKAYIDEAAFASKYGIDLVKGRLVTTNGQLILITTPNGTGSWFYEDYISNPKEFVEYIKFSIYDNPIITEEAVERLKQSYDPLLYRQEILGEWVNLFKNQVYYSFSDANISDCPYDKNLPVYIGLDFNIDKNAWAAFQKYPNNTIQMIYEGYGAKTTADLAAQLISKFGDQVIVIPDATGGNRVQGVAQTNFQLLRQSGLNRIVENRTNPDRLKRYAIVNATLENAKGEHRLLIDKSCKESIRELRELTYKPGTDRPDSKGDTIAHRTDCIGYAINHLTYSQVGTVNQNTNNFMDDWKRKANAYKNF
jgi:PBSX family phage terminase large subunit